MRFDEAVLSRETIRRRRYLEILESALAAVDPYEAVAAVLRREGDTLKAGDRGIPLVGFRRVLVVGAGKAGAPMARAVEDCLDSKVAGGLVVVKTGHSSPTRRVEIVEASHPIPDAAGVAAGSRMLRLLEETQADDLVIAVISGGGSALLEAPAGITLDDLQAMTDALLACGATINEINCLRKHMSAVKGGQLARASHPATLVTLVLSDVVGSPLDVIASGPTVPDSSTWADAWAVVESYGLEQRLPAAVIERLRAGLAGAIADTPKPGDAIFERTQTIIVADNRIAALAACARAEALGYSALLLSTYVEGEAAGVARVAVALGKEVQASHHPVAPPACLVLGGETTVTLGASPGHGGRNQELALAAALALDGTTGITVAALATDGTDGPTDSAGGLADAATVARGRAAGLDAVAYLRGHDAYPFLHATGDLLLSGPTQTNVNDLLFVFVEPG
ncbi:MAG: glycerate kinase [Caldilineaceae bacterium]|nr:glycerate kinase [Caldilineaceae bacterium]